MHDWIVSHTLQNAALEAGKGRRPGFTLEQSERRKDSYAKRRCEVRGLDFVPLAMDTLEEWESARRKRFRLLWPMHVSSEEMRFMIGMCRGEG